jgi:hypothetical protein
MSHSLREGWSGPCTINLYAFYVCVVSTESCSTYPRAQNKKMFPKMIGTRLWST